MIIIIDYDDSYFIYREKSIPDILNIVEKLFLISFINFKLSANNFCISYFSISYHFGH